MQPTQIQIKQFVDVLLNAFNHKSLTLLVKQELDLDLQTITPAGGSPTLTDIVYYLVCYYAAQDGGLKNLLTVAVTPSPANENSVTPELLALSEEWASVDFEVLPLPVDHPLKVDTQGGAYIIGDLKIDGEFVGRDKIIHGDTIYGDKFAGDQIVVNSHSEQQKLDEYIDKAATRFESRMYGQMIGRSSEQNPYVGLSSFSLKDANIFFGRNATIEILYGVIANEKNRLAIIHAPSGAGKTSVLQAGIGPRLIENGSLPIFPRSIYPIAYKYGELSSAIKYALVPPSEGLKKPKSLDTLSLSEYLGYFCRKLSRKTKELVIVLDQFEEIFFEPIENHTFINELAKCYHDEELPLRIIIAIRDDYLSQLSQLKEHFPEILKNEFLLLPMNQEEKIQAITNPLTKSSEKITFTEQLVNKLIEDLSDSYSILPHLQLICTELYQLTITKSQAVLDLQDYDNLGEVNGVLIKFMQRVIKEMTSENATITRRILSGLVSNNNQRETLTTTQIEELLHVSKIKINLVLEELVRERLVQRYEINNEVFYQLTHDSLVKEIQTWFTSLQPDFEQLRLIKDTFLNTYSFNYLKQMHSMFLEEPLSNVVPISGRNMEEIIEDLVSYYSTKYDGIRTLIDAALNYMEENEQISIVEKHFEGIKFIPLPTLQEALLSSYLDITELRHMIYFQLDIYIDDYIPIHGRSFRQVVDDVVHYFANIRHGWDHLVAASRSYNPHNLDLSQIETQLYKFQRISLPPDSIQLSPLNKLRNTILQHVGYDDETRVDLDYLADTYLDVSREQITRADSLRERVGEIILYVNKKENGLLKFVCAIQDEKPSIADEIMALCSEYNNFDSSLKNSSEPLFALPSELIDFAVDACLDAYDMNSLEMIVRFELDKNLYSIAPIDGNSQEVIKTVVQKYSNRIEDFETLILALAPSTRDTIRYNIKNPEQLALRLDHLSEQVRQLRNEEY